MIIGHIEIIDKLNTLISNNEVAHSYIFNGPEGIGKKLVAIQFAKNILCGNDEKEKISFDNGNHPDFKLIEPDEKGTIKIETIREIVKDILVKPIVSKYKVYIIDQSDTITTQAQNALLKTLEEPPQYAIIILLTSRYNSLLSTIRSRSQKLDFKKLQNSDIIKYMNDNKINIDLEENILTNLINGSIGNIQKVLDNIEPINKLIQFSNEIDKLNIVQINKFAQQLLEYKNEILILLDYLQTIMYINEKSVKTSEYIKIIEDTKRNILGNINFEICIDKMLLSIWEVNNV